MYLIEPHEVIGALNIFCGGLVMAINDSMQEATDELSKALGHHNTMGICCFGEQGMDHQRRACHGNLMFGCLLFSNKQRAQLRTFKVGDCAFMLNPVFRDGTRLRAGPRVDDEFNGQFVLNDQQVKILAIEDGLAKICSCGEGVTNETRVEGWVRMRNLSAVQRAVGL